MKAYFSTGEVLNWLPICQGKRPTRNVFETNVNIVVLEVGRLYVVFHDIDYVSKSPSLPPIRNAIDHFNAFVARETKMDKPLAIQ